MPEPKNAAIHKGDRSTMTPEAESSCELSPEESETQLLPPQVTENTPKM